MTKSSQQITTFDPEFACFLPYISSELVDKLSFSESWNKLRDAVSSTIPEPEVNKILAILDQTKYLYNENKELEFELEMAKCYIYNSLGDSITPKPLRSLVNVLMSFPQPNAKKESQIIEKSAYFSKNLTKRLCSLEVDFILTYERDAYILTKYALRDEFTVWQIETLGRPEVIVSKESTRNELEKIIPEITWVVGYAPPSNNAYTSFQMYFRDQIDEIVAAHTTQPN